LTANLNSKSAIICVIRAIRVQSFLMNRKTGSPWEFYFSFSALFRLAPNRLVKKILVGNRKIIILYEAVKKVCH